MPGHWKRGGALVLSLAWLIGGCSVDTKDPIPEITEAKPAAEGMQTAGLPEGSTTRQPMPSEVLKQAEGSDSDVDGHPVLDPGQQPVQRNIVVPASVDGKWKSVKIFVRNKRDEEKSRMRTVDLGSSFTIEGTGIHVNVGPFLPNFMMDAGSYTSNGNELSNPAVRIVVKEGDKQIFEGWAFAKFPGMYAFEHEAWGLQLMDFIPMEVS